MPSNVETYEWNGKFYTVQPYGRNKDHVVIKSFDTEEERQEYINRFLEERRIFAKELNY